MQLYRFSPITTVEKLHEAIIYTATKSTELCHKATGESFPIISLTVFAHYADEYKVLKELLSSLGSPVGENNGPRVELTSPTVVGANTITHLRIRNPDPYRTQVGLNDFEVADYAAFKNKFLVDSNKNLRLLVRADYELIEFFDPDFDVLGYVLSAPEKSKK